MPFKLTQNVHVGRDRDGRIRQLSHPKQPYRPDAVGLAINATVAAALTPRMLADQYVRDVSGLLDLAVSATANFAAAPSSSPTQAGTELRFKEEKAVGNTATVSYDQCRSGLPLWNAGLSVRINTASMEVIGAHNATHYDIDVQLPQPQAPFAPNLIEVSKLKTALGLGPDDRPTVNAARLLIYYYAPNERLDSQTIAHQAGDEAVGFGGETEEFPSLPLPPVPADIVPGQHYVVTEVLFTLTFRNWGRLNWRTFIEPESGAVLYLRALVSCAQGSVFLTDPVTATGIPHSAADPASDLDAICRTIPLLGLAPVSDPQHLLGEFVKLAEVDPPTRAMPSEHSPFDFSYSCKTDNFAACSAYIHCDSVFRAIQGMGIDVQQYFNNTDFPVPVDPHALQGQVNAQARGNTMGNGMGAFVFGSASLGGTMGIAADVRVVLHEFGHALLWDHVSSPNFGFAHSAGDSLGAILHDPDSKTHALGSTVPDRFETFPFMKASAGLSRRHDRKVADGWAWFGPQWNDQYGGEQVLSTTLFRVYRAAGGDSDDLDERKFAARYVVYLIIAGVGLLTFTAQDPDVYASALTEADASTVTFEGFPGGAFGKVIRWSFEKQGLYQPAGAPVPVTNEGDPPGVDIYIEDGRNGVYLPFQSDFRGKPEIWNRHAPDGGVAHEPPTIGSPNSAYVTVRNRGTAPATEVTVRAFQSRAPDATVWPTDWKPLATPQLAVAGSIAPGGHVIVGPFLWTPQFAGENLVFSASAPGDMSNLETLQGAIPTSRLVRLDNNIAQRDVFSGGI